MQTSAVSEGHWDVLFALVPLVCLVIAGSLFILNRATPRGASLRDPLWAWGAVTCAGIALLLTSASLRHALSSPRTAYGYGAGLRLASTVLLALISMATCTVLILYLADMPFTEDALVTVGSLCVAAGCAYSLTVLQTARSWWRAAPSRPKR
jgi:hypothetical protein